MFNWKKLGLVYGPDGSMPWMKSNAMILTPLLLNDGIIRVFIAFFDAKDYWLASYVSRAYLSDAMWNSVHRFLMPITSFSLADSAKVG